MSARCCPRVAARTRTRGAAVGQDPGDHPAAEAADRVARDVQPHDPAKVGRLDILGEVGHGRRGHPGQGEALQDPDDDQRGQGGGQRRGQAEYRGGEQRADHDPPPPEDLRQRAHRDDGQHERPGARGHRQARRRGRRPERRRHQWQHRLRGRANVASPAANSPSRTRRIPGSPCRSRALSAVRTVSSTTLPTLGAHPAPVSPRPVCHCSRRPAR